MSGKIIKRIIGFSVLSILLLITAIYIYLSVKPLNLFDGFSFNNDGTRVTVYVASDTRLPVFIDDVRLIDELGNTLQGNKYTLIVESFGMYSFREQFMEDHDLNIIKNEPFDGFHLEHRKSGYKYGVFFEEMEEFQRGHEIIIEYRVLGIFPFKQTYKLTL